MNILIVGGTRFVGRAVAHEAVRRGHTVSVLNRGVTPDDLPASVTRLRGDRSGDLSALNDKTFDVTIDTIAYRPVEVSALHDALGNRGGHHIQVSSISAYQDPSDEGATEESLEIYTDEFPEELVEITGQSYGPLKAACERRAKALFGTDNTTIVRPTYVVGSHDLTMRFPYWVHRALRGGEVLIPGPESDPLQWIDARDLASFILETAERGLVDDFHVCGPTPGPRFTDVIKQLLEILSPAGTTNKTVGASTLQDAGVTPQQLPLWSMGEPATVLALSNAKAVSAGLTLRTLADTAQDTATWLSGALAPSHWLSPEREAELLA